MATENKGFGTWLNPKPRKVKVKKEQPIITVKKTKVKPVVEPTEDK